MSLLFLGSPVVLFGILAFVSGQEQQLLMVFGGRGCEAIQGCPYANNVTLISLDGGPSVPDCLNNLGPPPKRLYSACQATLGEGKLPHVCGGRYFECDEGICNNFVNDECYRYDPDLDTWKVSGVMSEAKDDGLACAVNSVPEMIMNGGDASFSPFPKPRMSQLDDEVAETTIFTSDGQTFGQLPKMPVGLNYHCAVALDNGDLFVTGGDTRPLVPGINNNGTTFLYHSDTMEWEVLQDMPTPRVGLQCAMVHNADGEQEIIAAGGYYENVVEIYNLRSQQWRAGNPMPLQAYLGYGTVVQLEETFLIVGGFHYGEYLDTIYRYEKDSDSWTRLEAILPGVVAAPIAMMVDIDIFPSC